MKICAVVVTYNRKKLLKECLEAINNQEQSVDKIILIDNNSTDGTYEYLIENKLLNDNLEYIKLPKNIGGAGGFYEGFKVAQKYQPDWLWIMDDDTIPTSSCLLELVKSIEIIDEKISYLASTIYGENKEFMNVPNINFENSKNGYPNWYKYLSEGIVKIKEATFVSLLINNEAVRKIGFPVKDYFIWGDDTEYTLRLNKFFGKSFFVGKSIAIHKRMIARRLSIYEEENPTRIDFYYYMIRNNLINQANYYGFYNMIIEFIKWQIKSILVLLKLSSKKRFKKFTVIHKALLSYTFKAYDVKSFKNRFDINYDKN